MPASKPPPEKPPADPAQLPEREREYYRSTWGFDPVGDCWPLTRGERRYEAGFPLDHDPPLQAAGLTIAACVDWKVE